MRLLPSNACSSTRSADRRRPTRAVARGAVVAIDRCQRDRALTNSPPVPLALAGALPTSARAEPVAVAVSRRTNPDAQHALWPEGTARAQREVFLCVGVAAPRTESVFAAAWCDVWQREHTANMPAAYALMFYDRAIIRLSAMALRALGLSL